MMDFDPDDPGCAGVIIIACAAGGTVFWTWLLLSIIFAIYGQP